ncbi:hypothetical protein IQ259_11995 [Fortiea sp. LEGE XX443]|uniref:hypothetical protein n=1 Tax=Fortiea sp. LEGE XX443 TaxID=1828611 RepID=UPI001880D1C9|nr:hypothetical protein [Fortiea sp. LEGE XX443]MBE9005748.1 hypothetical protein [Fortiea sp. LEGE XX443]
MTDSVEQPPSRLDQIEQMLLLTVTTVGDIAKQQQTNTQAIAQVTTRLDQLTLKVDQLTLKVDNLTDDVNLLTDYFTQIITNAESDRAAFQAEIRRIWEYLLQQGRNGHNGDTGV